MMWVVEWMRVGVYGTIRGVDTGIAIRAFLPNIELATAHAAILYGHLGVDCASLSCQKSEQRKQRHRIVAARRSEESAAERDGKREREHTCESAYWH